MPLDFAALGHSTALAACSALLWDVARFLNTEDVDNPVMAIEDAVAMTPQPGMLATWPSLYKCLCEVAQGHGTPEAQVTKEVVPAARSLLLSQLKPLLRTNWHASFNECGLYYLSEQGSTVKLKKMKHLVQAVIRWRKQHHDASKAFRRSGEVDAALAPGLELVPSEKHNDLLLRLLPPAVENVPVASLSAAVSTAVNPKIPAMEPAAPAELSIPLPRAARRSWADYSEVAESELGCCSPSESSWSASGTASARQNHQHSSSSEDLKRELASLPAENPALRNTSKLLQQSVEGEAGIFRKLFCTPTKFPLSSEPEIFDDPFEPPPQSLSQGRLASSCCSTTSGSGSLTPFYMASGTATPAPTQGTCALVPLWFPMGDRVKIPSGIVQQAKTLFERADGATFFNGHGLFAQR